MKAAAAAASGLAAVVLVASASLASPPVGARVVTHELNIPVQDLGEALKALSVMADEQLLFSDQVVAGKKSVEVEGAFTTEEALKLLLQGSGLKAERTPSGVVLVRKEGAGEGGPRVKTGNALNFRVVQTEPGNTTNGNLEAVQPELSEIVVTAQKREERLKDVPISISVLSGEELDTSRAQGLQEALSRVPGVTTMTIQQGGGTQVAMRGVTASAPLFGGASPIGFYIDSVPVGLTGLIASAVLPDVTAYDMARVEVLRGPQGTLHGASAAGGLVRILTHDADLNRFSFKGTTTVSYTDDGEGNYRADTALNVPLIEGKLAARAVLGYQNVGGWIDNSVERDVNGADLRNYRLKVKAQPNERFSIGLSAWRSRQDFDAPNRSDDDRRSSTSLSEPQWSDWDVYGAKLEYEFPVATLSSATGYFEFNNPSFTDVEPLLNTPFYLYSAFEGHVFSEEIVLNSNGSGPWKWSLGGIYRDSKGTLIQIASGTPFDQLSSFSKSYAVFGNVSRKFADNRLEWTLGGRYFYDDLRDENETSGREESAEEQEVSPRFVLSWYPNSDVTVYGQYAEGFRSGAAEPVNNLGLPQLRADTLRNFEVGVKGDTFNRRLSFEVAAYYMKWDDVQQNLTVTRIINGTPVLLNGVVNGESASGPGVDFGLTLRPAQGLDLGINASWNDLTFDQDVVSNNNALFLKGERLSYSAEFMGGVFGDFAFPLGGSQFKGKFSAAANYTTRQTFRSNDGSESIGGVHLFARSSFAIVAPRGWMVTLFVENLTNEYDGQPGQATGFLEWYPRPRPRTLGLQFDYRFDQ